MFRKQPNKEYAGGGKFIREAFKKKSVTFVTPGGGPARQNVTLFKVVFKIHFRPF